MWLEHLLIKLLNSGRTEIARTDVEGPLLGIDVDTRRPVHMASARRCEHLVIVGKTGSGKSYFLEHLALEHMRRGEGFVFFDFHGDAVQALMRLATTVPGADERIVFVDPSHSARSPGLNPLENADQAPDQVFVRTSELATILRHRWNVDSFGARTEELLRNTLYTLAHHGLTLVDLPRLLTATAWRHQLAAALPSAEIRDYWQQRFEPLSDAMKIAVREPLLNKVTAFLTDPAIRHVLGQTRSTIRFDRHMADGDWVFINLNKGRLREHAQTLGNLIFAKLQFEVLARSQMPQRQRRVFSIMCDEVQNLADNDLATLLTEGRKFGVSVITANQFWEQSPKPLRSALLAAGSQAFFRLSAMDARALAPELTMSAGQRFATHLTELGRGEAIVRIGARRPQLIRVPSLPTMSAATTYGAERLYSLSIGRYTKERTEIDREIDERRSAVPGLTSATHPRTYVRDNEGQTEW